MCFFTLVYTNCHVSDYFTVPIADVLKTVKSYITGNSNCKLERIDLVTVELGQSCLQHLEQVTHKKPRKWKRLVKIANIAKQILTGQFFPQDDDDDEGKHAFCKQTYIL